MSNIDLSSYNSTLGTIFGFAALVLTGVRYFENKFKNEPSSYKSLYHFIKSNISLLILLVIGFVIIFLPYLLNHLLMSSKETMRIFANNCAIIVLGSISLLIILFCVGNIFSIRKRYYDDYLRRKRDEKQ